MRKFLGVAGAVLLLAGAARADFVPAIDFDAGRSNFPAYDGGVWGYSFSVGSTPITIDAVGSTQLLASGNIRIWLPGTTTNIVDQYVLGDVTATTSQPNPNTASGFNTYGYVSITPVVLSANTTYDIAWDPTSDFGEAFWNYATPIVNDPNITFGHAVSSAFALDTSSTTSDNFFPTTDEVNDFYGGGFGAGPYFGPAFQIAAPAAAPLPSSAWGGATLIALTAGCSLRRRAMAE